MAAEILKCLDQGSLLEKVVGRRQSVIFGLLLVAVYLASANKTDLAGAVIGFVGLLIKDYVEDVGKEYVE